MTEGIKAFSTKIYIGDGASPEVFTKIDEVYSIGPIGGSKTTVDFSNHDSLEYEEFQVYDLKTGNEVAVEANYIDANTSHDLVRAADASSALTNFKVVYRDGSYDLVPVVVLSSENDASDMKGRVVFRFSLKIAAAPTHVDAP